MPHSAAFNAARREAYAEGRRLGLSRREAGHLLSLYPPEGRPLNTDRYASFVRASEAKATRTERQGTVAERQATFDTLHPKGHYLVHNDATVYTKVSLRLRDTETGEILTENPDGRGGTRSKVVTLKDNRRLTREEALTRIEGWLRNPKNVEGSDPRPVEVVALSFDMEYDYPDVKYFSDVPQE